jgi:MFS family permease
VPWLVTAQGVGAVIGALTLPSLAKRTSRLKVLKSSVAGVAVGLALYGAAPNLALAVAALALLGAAYVGTITGLNTSVQLHAPVKERSRILSLYTLSLSIFYPIGALAQATMAKYWGVRPVTMSAAGLLAVVFVLVTVRRPLFWTEIGSTSGSPVNLLAE